MMTAVLDRASQGLTESVDVLHDGKNVGATPVELVVVYLGEKSNPILVGRKG
jgi:hypothetical protein